MRSHKNRQISCWNLPKIMMKKYNVVTNNCTTFAVDALKSIGINVPTTEKTWTLPDNIEEMIGCNEFIIRLLGI